MLTIDSPAELRSALEAARAEGKVVGFYPTMGAFHGGHLANIRKAAAECDVVAVSIFVNPLQFGPGEDFAAYPRDLARDCQQAQQAGADIVFAPATTTVFPDEPQVTVRVNRLADVLEGAHRPGHFDGVATIVTKLLALAGPCFGYFGEKDFQQLVVVRHLVADLSLPAVVVACPTVREPDGLALSSRNAYLNEAERAAAPVLYWSLLAGKRAIEDDRSTNVSEVRAAMVEVAQRQELFELDYAEVVEPGTLSVPVTVPAPARLLVAGRIGKTRLIDNVAAAVEE